MTAITELERALLTDRLTEAESTIAALLAGQIDAVIDVRNSTPVLLSKAQDALRESEERYRQIVEMTSDGIFKLDADGTIAFVNQRLAEMLGYSVSDLVGRRGDDVLGTTATIEPGDAVLRHRDGTAIAVSVAKTRLVGADGARAGHLAFVRDVTEYNKLQAQLIVSDRMASIGTLAAGVAHEINNPLAAVLGNLEYIRESLAEVPEAMAFRTAMAAALADAIEAAHRVRFIVRDLKIFGRGPSEESAGPVNLRAILESSLRMAHSEVRDRARVVTSYGEVPAVAGNEARLGQVFLNLIINAAQAITEARIEQNEIRVVTQLVSDRVVVEVHDTGRGIPPEVIGRIFDAFFTTKAVGVGMGLGLAICYRIVTDMGGELTVASVLGVGTTFRVALPIVREEARVATQAREAIAPERRGRILIVDDEPTVVRILQRLLDKEHDVTATHDAREALALCAGGAQFDLILCDLMMPQMTGMELHRELVRISPALAARMIFVTGGAFTAEARQFMAERPSEILEKPFKPANLRVIVQRYLFEKAPADGRG